MNTSQSAAAPEQEGAELNQAIEELRGALNDGGAGAAREAAGRLAENPLVMSIPVEVQIILGSAEMSVSDLMALQKGSTVALDRRVGEPVDIAVNGRRIARGEIIVVDPDASRFGVRLTEIATAASVER